MPAPARQQTPFDYWISFWPTAPLFGVKWRFEGIAPGTPFFQPAEVAAQMTIASAREVARAASEQAEAVAIAAAEAVDAAQVAAAVEVPVQPEPVAVQPEPVAVQPEPEAQPEPAVAGTGALRPALLFDTPPVEADDLKQIKGVGPKLEAMLNGMGIYRFDQIAAMTDDNLQWVDDNLTTFKGRPFRDDWVTQARALA